MVNTQLIREQLDTALRPMAVLTRIQVPAKGWIRAIREALGMSSRQLGARLGVSQQRATVIESAERGGNLSIKTMRAVAEALDCEFVYAFVPRHGIQGTVRQRAEAITSRRLGRVVQTMQLEDQGLSVRENDSIQEALISEIISNMPRTFWDDIE